ncbi:MAG: hypothetical protein ACI9G1_000028 [Pirellulaceae bacterium]|jgi:hypothetical protein
MTRRTYRSGMSTLEVAMAAAMLAVAAIAMTILLSLVMKQSQLSERETIATLEASNILERTYAIPYAILASGPPPFELSPTLTALENAIVTLSVVDLADADSGAVGQAGKAAKQVTVEIVWGNVHKPMYRPVRLSTWRYAEEETQ